MFLGGLPELLSTHLDKIMVLTCLILPKVEIDVFMT